MRTPKNHYTCGNCGSKVSRSGTGLGTWRCEGKCKYVRFVTVNKFTGSGKESEKRNIEPRSVMRHIPVKVTHGRNN